MFNEEWEAYDESTYSKPRGDAPEPSHVRPEPGNAPEPPAKKARKKHVSLKGPENWPKQKALALLFLQEKPMLKVGRATGEQQGHKWIRFTKTLMLDPVFKDGPEPVRCAYMFVHGADCKFLCRATLETCIVEMACEA